MAVISRANLIPLILCLATVGSHASPNLNAQLSDRSSALKHIDDLTRQGAFSGAREELKDLLKKYPQDIDVCLSAARFYKTIGLPNLALQEYKRAIALGCRASEPFVAVAQICLANLDDRQALEYARKAIAIEATSKEARIVLVSALLNEGKLDEAGQQLANVLAGGKDASDADLNYLAYKLTSKRRQLALAKQCLDNAIRLKPAQTKWLLDRADLYISLGKESRDPIQKMEDYRAAKRALERFLDLKPRSVEGLNRFGELLEFYFYDFDNASKQYEKILAIDPDYVAAITGLTRCKANQNDIAGQMKLEFWNTLRQLKDGLLSPSRGRL